MSADILVAEDVRELLDTDVFGALSVDWLGPDVEVPSGAYRAFMLTLARHVGEAELDRLPNLEILANCVVGVDNIDVRAAAARNIVVTNTPDVLTDSTADLTWALILAAARRLKEGQALLEQGQWRGWHPTLLLGMELRNHVLGVVGPGRIGQAVGRRAPGFGMRVAYAGPSAKEEFERAVGATRLDLSDLLAASDVVTLHAPLTDATRGMIDRAAIARCTPGAILVNTARGDLIDEDAVLEALDAGRLSAVGLDVFVGEPRVDPRLVAHPRVICLPHLGSATRETRTAMVMLAARNVREVLDGRPPLTPVIVDKS
jgi:glyoxylate reductase